MIVPTTGVGTLNATCESEPFAATRAAVPDPVTPVSAVTAVPPVTAIAKGALPATSIVKPT